MNEHIEQRFQAVAAFHEATKHYIYRTAASPGYMDWDNQPNPFRLYEGIERLILPFIETDSSACRDDLYLRQNNQPKPFDRGNIGAFLELSLGLSAWKSYAGDSWALRMNPSSGNLHPTECYLVLPKLEDVQAGVYHYTPLIHSLEQRALLDENVWESIHGHFACEGFLVALTSIFWRESWKYGERAFRYCNHDVGHALAAMSISANLLGWKMVCLNSLADRDIETLLGLDKTAWHDMEAEHPDVMCWVFPTRYTAGNIPRDLPGEVVRRFADLSFVGTPNRLSAERRRWEAIYHTAEMTRKERTEPQQLNLQESSFKYRTGSRFPAARIIRKRRSGVDFDIRRSQIGREEFLSLLDKTLPRSHYAPFDMELQSSSIHLLIFVHRVTGLEEGLYAFVRSRDDLPLLKQSFHSRFRWEETEQGFPLYLLEKGNYRGIAARVSCEQEIAGDSAFSLGMIANFVDTIRQQPFRYRNLYWEAGMVGQVLYLEAEANGISGTGIGCFFDNDVHAVAGIRDNRFQSLYHFTVGSAIIDHRLTTLSPYFHLEPQQNYENK
jgi:SagB-type dehydrogenase family enzyme